jgi:hypothetical protein
MVSFGHPHDFSAGILILEAGHAHVLLIWESAWVTTIFSIFSLRTSKVIMSSINYYYIESLISVQLMLMLYRLAGEILKIAAHATITPSESVSGSSSCKSRCTLRLHLLRET